MRLVNGEGSPTTGACWMSALHYYTRQDASWTDRAPWACVSPVIRTLCIRLNDLCSDGEREALIGPHLFTPIGTASSPEIEQRRTFLCADRAVRVFAPMALDARGLKEQAKRLRAAREIVDRETALEGRDAANAAAYAAHAIAANAIDLVSLAQQAMREEDKCINLVEAH